MIKISKRLRLVHLSVVGKDRVPATIEFGDHLTIIHGASDTGKSHIFDLLRYIVGVSKSVAVPDEGKGYQYVHLCVEATDGDVITLVRDLEGGKIGVAEGDVRTLVEAPLAEYLDPRHVSKNPNSVSRRLLSLVDLDEKYVRKSQNNDTRMLEWRDVMRLAAVDEETIIAKRSPIESGQHSSGPVESAIFRLFIQGGDDSGLVEIPKAAELKKISINKLEILDKIIADLEEELANVPAEGELKEQLGRLNATMTAVSLSVGDVSRAREELVLTHAASSNKLAEARARYDELVSLAARFHLLRAQYDSDLERLHLLSEATDVLSLADDEDCPFCGASANHQHWPEPPSMGAGSSTFNAAIAAEQAKIQALRVDLNKAITALEAERAEISSVMSEIVSHNDELVAAIRGLDKDLQEPSGDLTQLLATRSDVERKIDAHSRLAGLLELRASTAQVEKPKTSTEISFASSDLRMFDDVAEEILRQWAFPSGSSVSYSTVARDLVVDQRPRQSHGKGVRSILHALFNVALAEYCFRREFGHPGFVILDSPIVSYRQADEPVLVGEEETISSSVVDAFYRYMQSGFSGQSLVLENKSPVTPLPDGTREYYFGGAGSGVQRSGFYPCRAEDQ